MGRCACVEVERNVVAVSRVHGAVIRERAPNPTMDVQKMFAWRGEACVRGWGEERALGRDRVWERCARSSDDEAAGVHQCAGARRAHLERSRGEKESGEEGARFLW